MRELDTPLLQYLLQRGTAQLRTQPAVDLWATAPDAYLDVAQLSPGLLQQLLHQVEVTAPVDAKLPLSADWSNRTVGLGYPLVSLPDPNRPGQRICAPLLIWELDFTTTGDQYRLHRTAAQPIRFNEALASYLRPDALATEPPLPDLLLQDQLLDPQELLLVLQRGLQYLAPQQLLPPLLAEAVQGPLQPLPTRDQRTTGLHLHWSALLAQFPAQQGAVLRDLRAVLHHFSSIQPLLTAPLNAADPDRSAFMKHSFEVLPTDPCQQALLHGLHRGQHLRLQVSTKTDGTRTITGVIANILSNAGTCLVVSDQPETLAAIREGLTALGMGELVGDLQDTAGSRQALCQSIRQRAAQAHPVYRVPDTFIHLLQSCAGQVKQLQAFAEKLQQPLLDQHNWTAVVGELVQARTHLPQSPLQGQLQAQRFQFTPTEYDQLQTILPEGQALFDELGSLQHPLNVLHDRFFEQANALEMEERTQTAVDKVIEVVQKAQRDAYAYLFEYEQLLEKHFGKVYTAKMQLAERIIDDIKIGLADSKFHFNRSDGFYRKFMKRVSDKHQQLEEQKITILETFYQLQRVHLLYRYFPFTFLDTSNSRKLVFSDLLEHLEDYKLKLYDWYEGRTALVQQLVRELGPNKIYPQVSFDRRVKEITRNLRSFERNFVDSQIFKVGFSFQSTTIRKCLTQIEGLERNLEQLKEALGSFRRYHALKYFWIALPPLQRHLIEVLTQTTTTDWPGAFATWYLDALLRRHEDEQVPDARRYQGIRDGLNTEQERLRQRLVPHTLSYWRGKQTQAAQAFHQAQAPLTVGALYASSGQRSLRTLIATDPDLFFSFCPVVLAHPSAVAALLPLQVRGIDVGLVLDAHRLTVDQGLPTLLRSKYHLVAGDPQQPPPPAAQSPQGLLTAGLSASALPLAKAQHLLMYARWLPRFQVQQLRVQAQPEAASQHQGLLLLPASNSTLADQPSRPLAQQLCRIAQEAFPRLQLEVRPTWRGLPADLAIVNASGVPQAVCYVDTYSDSTSDTAYAWDLFLEQYWTELGIPCYRVWSKDWWQTPETAVQDWRNWLGAQAAALS